METCVEAALPGTSYRAANWAEVGMTAGRGPQDTAGRAALGAKRVLLYPLASATLKHLCPRRVATPAGWVHREFGGAELGDRRLAARLLDLAGAFFAQPQANIPQACGSAAAAKAAYRFFDNEQVTMDALLEPHHQATIGRIRREPVVLVAQDTTSLCYTTHPGMQGIGPIGNSVNGPQGLEMHSALAFRPDGLPLGLLDIECWALAFRRHAPSASKRWALAFRRHAPSASKRWAREAATFGKRHDCNAKPIEDKESNKWLTALTSIGAAAARWRIHYLTTLGRATPDVPCTVAFGDDQWQAVVVFKTRKPPPEQRPSLRQMIRTIAQPGGFL